MRGTEIHGLWRRAAGAAALALLAACEPEPAPPGRSGAALELARTWRVALEEGRASTVADEARARLSAAELARDGECLALAARALAEIGAEDEADERLAAARVSAADTPWIALARGRLALGRDEPERALEILADLGEEGPADLPEILRLRGLALQRLGRGVQAESALEEYVARSPTAEGAPEAWHALAELARARGAAEIAAQRQARAEAAGRWRTYLVLRRQQAREHPDDPRPALALARLWLEAERPAEARATLESLLERHTASADGFAMLGDALRREGDLAGALAAWTRALEIDPALDLARYNRAHALVLADRLDEARAELELLVDGPRGADPRLGPAHRELVDLLLRQGAREEAERRAAVLAELGRRTGPEPAPR